MRAERIPQGQRDLKLWSNEIPTKKFWLDQLPIKQSPKFLHPPSKTFLSSLAMDKEVLSLGLQKWTLSQELTKVQATEARLTQQQQETLKKEALLKAALQLVENQIKAHRAEQRKQLERALRPEVEPWEHNVNELILADRKLIINKIIPMDFCNRDIPKTLMKEPRLPREDLRMSKFKRPLVDHWADFNIKKEDRFALLDERPSKLRPWER